MSNEKMANRIKSKIALVSISFSLLTILSTFLISKVIYFK